MFKFKAETVGWFKQKITEAVANAIIYGFGIIILWAVYVSISGERQMKDISEGLNSRMTNFFNEGVTRDKEFNGRIDRMEMLLELMLKQDKDRPKAPRAPKRHRDDYYEKHHKKYTPIPQQQQQQQMAPQQRSR